MRDYSPLAIRVFDAGFTFVVDAGGKPHIARSAPVELGEEAMDTAGIIEAALAIGCTDNESLSTLQFGARSHSNPPKVSVFYPNHRGAREYATTLDGILDEEVGRGWVERSAIPSQCQYVDDRSRPCRRQKKKAVWWSFGGLGW